MADIGTGTASWLLDLARSCPASWSLEGFDVTDRQYPIPADLPSNVSLSLQDAFAPALPERLHEAFDIVHIRAFAIVVKNGDPSMLVDNALRMLKPGGFLQWEEMESSSFRAYSAVPGLRTDAASETIRAFQKFPKALSIDFGWMAPGALAARLRGKGMIVRDNVRYSDPLQLEPFLRTPYTTNWMRALADVTFLMIGRGGATGDIISAEDFATLMNKMTAEVEKGVHLWIDIDMVVAQKPSST